FNDSNRRPASSSMPTTSKIFPWMRNWATEPDLKRSRICSAQLGNCLIIAIPFGPSQRVEADRLEGPPSLHRFSAGHGSTGSYCQVLLSPGRFFATPPPDLSKGRPVHAAVPPVLGSA